MTDRRQFVDTTETQMTLRQPLEHLDEADRVAIAAWMTEHGIDPDTVALNVPIERNAHTLSVSWREQTPDGLVVHSRFPPVTGRWPAPFPDSVLHPRLPSAPAKSA